MSTRAFKSTCGGRLLKLLQHKSYNRGMEIIPEQSRCVRRGEIHEVVSTDQHGLVTGGRVDRVGFLGFMEFDSPGVIEAGDILIAAGREVGVVVGFDGCHFPNHYNIIVEVPDLLTADEFGLAVGHSLYFLQSGGAPESAGQVSIVAGFGHAGQDLHLPVLRKAFGASGPKPVYVLDPSPDGIVRARVLAERVIVLPDLFALDDTVRGRAVLHVCTPPPVRAQLLEHAVDLGIRHFVIEKPMANSADDLAAIRRLHGCGDIEIVVVSNWLSSALTSALRVRIGRRQSIRSMEIIQRKSRFERSMKNNGHSTAIDVEMPHMVALAQGLLGPLVVNDADCWDLEAGSGSVVTSMGGAAANLRSADDDVQVRLHSDLSSPVRERMIRVELADGRKFEGYYPVSSGDLFSQLLVFDSVGRIVERVVLEDDTLANLFVDAYRFFAGEGPRPVSDFAFHQQVCTTLDDIRHRSFGRTPVSTSLDGGLNATDVR